MFVSFKVFAPSLLNEHSNQGIGPNVQKLVSELESALGSVVRKSQPLLGGSTGSQKYSDNDFSGAFWNSSYSFIVAKVCVVDRINLVCHCMVTAYYAIVYALCRYFVTLG